MKHPKWRIRGFRDSDFIYFSGEVLSGDYCWSTLEKRGLKYNKKEVLEMMQSLSENPQFKKYDAKFVEV